VIAADFSQQLGVDISTANDGHIHRCVGSSLRWKRNAATATAPLGSATVFGFDASSFYGFANFVFFDGEDVVDVAPDVLEGDGAEALRASPSAMVRETCSAGSR